MKYYMIHYDRERDFNCVFCEEDKIGDVSRYDLVTGVYQKEWGDYQFIYDVTKGNVETDYVSNVLDWFICSERFYRAVSSYLEKSTQLLPVSICEKNNICKEKKAYVVNVLDILENAVDLEHSKYSRFDLENGVVYFVTHYAFYEEVVRNHDIFILKEYKMSMFISENIKRIIDDNHFTGFHITEVPVY